MSSALTQPDEIQLPLPPLPKLLADIAAGLACSVTRDGQDGFAGTERQDGDLRRFACLLHTPAYEAWLIAWEADADLELHDHGGSQGAFHVVDGALVEAHSDLAERAPLQTLVIGPGEGRDVTPTRVHRVWNPGPARAVSVHVYSPPLRSMTFYDDQPGTFLAPLRTDFVQGAPEPGGSR